MKLKLKLTMLALACGGLLTGCMTGPDGKTIEPLLKTDLTNKDIHLEVTRDKVTYDSRVAVGAGGIAVDGGSKASPLAPILSPQNPR